MKLVAVSIAVLALASGTVLAARPPFAATKTVAANFATGSGPSAATGEPGARPMGDVDDRDDEWRCTCAGTCDGRSHTVHPRICVDDDRPGDAVDDAVTACGRELDGQCQQAAHCTCQCRITGRNCQPDPPSR